MNSRLWTWIVVGFLVGALLVSLAACGSDPQTGAGSADAAGADVTVGDEVAPSADGTMGDEDASSGDDTTGDGTGDAATGDGTTGDATSANDADEGGFDAGDTGFDAGDTGTACFAGCPPSVQCGHYTDPCTGTTYACGQACPSGQVCVGSNGSTSCQPTSCAGKCGVVGTDSCGVPIGCGGCPTGQSCVKNQCVPSMPTDAGQCEPLTCTSGQTKLCGTVTDGCGHTLQCGCPSGQQCLGGVCSATPPECETHAGVSCGNVKNACGSGNVACPATCSGNNKCVGGVCTPCTPPSCNGATCGTVNNGCGGAVSCGTCSGGEVCDTNGSCCTPTTCAGALKAGLVHGCTPVDLGCGKHQTCSPCKAGDVCDQASGSCSACVAKTCADFGNAGCGHPDGCGKLLDCCASNLTCQGGVCCPPEQVQYKGSCCLPTCDKKLPPGPQVTCGQVIDCRD